MDEDFQEIVSMEDFKQLQLENQALKETVDFMRVQTEELKKIIHERREDNDDLQQKLKKQEEKVRRISLETLKLGQHLIQLQNKIESNQSTKKIQEVHSLQQIVAKLQAENVMLRKNSQNQSSKLKMFEQKIDEKSMKIRNLSNQIQSKELELKGLRNEYNLKSEQIKSNLIRIEKNQQKIQNLSLQLEEKEKIMKQKSLKYEQIANRNKELQISLANSSKNSDTQIDEVTDKLLLRMYSKQTLEFQDKIKELEITLQNSALINQKNSIQITQLSQLNAYFQNQNELLQSQIQKLKKLTTPETSIKNYFTKFYIKLQTTNESQKAIFQKILVQKKQLLRQIEQIILEFKFKN